ncbi:FK506 binding protein proline rotamase rapamycin-binding protein [Nowakowskiella sp. JEL0407]|nr:FK506 binding protein proline rotamase rapamycin-binding protein [Nowakowskiella sp. JEL0407]
MANSSIRPPPQIKKKKSAKSKWNDYSLVLGGVALIVLSLLLLVFLSPVNNQSKIPKKPVNEVKIKVKERPNLPWSKKTTAAGDGKTFPQVGDLVSLHYVGKVEETGIIFDSSKSRGQIFRFKVGSGQVIKGWDEAIPKMSLGEKAIVTLPPNFAYGESGVRDLIPPDATLVFDVELIGINDKFKPGFEIGKQKFSDEELEKRKKKLEEERRARAKEDEEKRKLMKEQGEVEEVAGDDNGAVDAVIEEVGDEL